MPVVPLLPHFHILNREHFDGSLTRKSIPLVSIRWSDGRLRKTAGMYRRKSFLGGLHTAEIVLSKPVLEHLPLKATISTLCHEMIHAWIDLVLNVEEGHGTNFHSRMSLINSSQDQFHVNVCHEFPLPASRPKWWGICPSCGMRFPYKRLVRGAACRECCNRHHGGKWHAGCELIYETVERSV